MTELADSLVALSWPHDSTFGAPYVDIDELRESPVPHRYVHGGFDSNATRFSFYFPAAEAYGGRFFQHVTPVPQSENLAQAASGEEDKIAFSLASGAYFVETNGGGPDAANPFSAHDPRVGAFLANAASAQFSRAVAAVVYGDHRAFGYLYGGSGGGYRTIGAAENTTGVWDGYVPYVIGSPMAAPNVFAVRMHAQRVLRDVFDDIVDAYDVGGNPDALVLDDDQREAFEEVTAMGFPPRSWFDWRTMGMHGFSALYPGILAADPTYATDFWTEDGYLGANVNDSVHRDRTVHETTVADIEGLGRAASGESSAGGVDESFQHATGGLGSGGGAPVAVVLDVAPTGWMLGAELHVRDGRAAGQMLRVAAVDGARVLLEPGQSIGGLERGDAVVLDNSNFLAAQTYHRHQVPGPEYAVYDRYRDSGGRPTYPQRPMLLGPMFAAAAAGSVPTGNINEKMIVISCLLDREAFPWQADWYRQRVAQLTESGAESKFRLWYIDNATHGDSEIESSQSRTVSYVGALHTALRQLAAWVEHGVEPAASSAYEIAAGQVEVPDTAAEREGVQPVISLRVNGDECTQARVGELIVVDVIAEVPSGGLPIVSLAFDLEGNGTIGAPLQVEPTRRVTARRECSFDAPGTYFLAARVTSQDALDAGTAAGRIHNIARARVTVT